MYTEDEYLQLSGIQHFAFCRRQWALIHIEQLWAENLRTVEGDLLHERAHDDFFSERRKDLKISRGLRIFSARLGVSGACDIVEFHMNPNGVTLTGEEGRWLPVPIEYKRGSPKEHDADRLQLCAQAICLEEMLACEIPAGYLYYGETRHRQKVELTKELREQVCSILEEMHLLYRRRYTPKVKPGKFCNACSLKELCLPKLCRSLSAVEYIKTTVQTDLQEDTPCDIC